MSEDYKEIVFKYLTGNLEEQTGTNEPKIEKNIATTSTLYNDIHNNYSSIVFYTGIVSAKDNKNQNMDYTVISCIGDLIGQSQTSGALAIVDKEFNLVQLITHYSDGNLIGKISCLNVDEKGNYYMVEQISSGYRIVLLNNLVLKPVGSNTFKAIKIETYSIPNQYTWDDFIKVFKNSDSSKYFVIGNRTNSDGIVGCHLTTSDNTWQYFTSTYEKSTSRAVLENGFNVYWDSDGNVQFQIAVSSSGLIILSRGTGTTMKATRYTGTEYSIIQMDCIFYSNKKCYYAELLDNDTTMQFNIFYINLDTKVATLVLTDDETYSLTRTGIYFMKNDNIIMYRRWYPYDSNNCKIYFGVLDGVALYETELPLMYADTTTKALTYPSVIKMYNTVYLYMVNRADLYYVQMNWNPDNYNGLAYISSASLVPQSISIEDENEVELYSRNIYNLTNYANTYTVSSNVPNYYLNNVNLNNAYLYSKGNNLMVGNPINITKNVYEELNINFNNTFTIYDNNVSNIAASSSFVSAMLNREKNAYIGKIRINYISSYTEIKNLTTNDLVYTYTDTGIKTTLKFAIKSTIEEPQYNIVKSIDIISQDENIIYKTIDCSSLEFRKYYLITQDIRIE